MYAPFVFALTAADFVSAGLALAAIIVSVIALWQTRRWRPRPLLIVELNELGRIGLFNGGSEYRVVRFANRGTADAIDVRCQFIDVEGHTRDEQSLGTLSTDQVGEILVGASTPMPSEYVAVNASFVPGEEDGVQTYRVRLLWRQPPRVETTRSLRVSQPERSQPPLAKSNPVREAPRDGGDP